MTCKFLLLHQLFASNESFTLFQTALSHKKLQVSFTEYCESERERWILWHCTCSCTLWQILATERRSQRITGNIKSFPGIPRPVYGCVSDPWSKTGFSKRLHLKLVRSSSGTPKNTPPLWRDWSGAAIWRDSIEILRCILWYLVSRRRRIPRGYILTTHIQRRKIRLIYTTSGLYTVFISNFLIEEYVYFLWVINIFNFLRVLYSVVFSSLKQLRLQCCTWREIVSWKYVFTVRGIGVDCSVRRE